MTKPENCRFCIDGIVIDTQLSNAMNGKIYGVSRDTVRRHKKHLDGAVKDPFGIPQEQITSRRKSVRLPDGSWEIVNFKPNTIVKENLKKYVEEDLASIFTQPVPEVKSNPTIGNIPLKVVNLADFQIGKVDVGGGTQETLARIRESVGRIISDIEGLFYDEIILADVGDIIENFYNTSSQDQTNDLYLTPQIRTARRIMAEIISLFAPLCRKLTYVSVPSNHCTVRKAPKAPASTPMDDFGIDISMALEEQFAGRKGYEHVSFVRPANDFSEEVVYFSRAGNTTFLFAHGHQRNSAFKLGEYVSDLSAYANSMHHNVQIAIFGHFHNRIQYEWHGREIHVCPASDNGSSWFSGRNGQWARSGILVFDVVDGRSYSPNIY